MASPRVGRKIFGLKNPAQRRAKGHFQLATWNVRSLVNASGPIETAFARGSRIPKDFDDRWINLVVEELKGSGIGVAGLQETRWFGQETYSVGDSVVLSSGRSLPPKGESLHRGEGVAVVLRGRAM